MSLGDDESARMVAHLNQPGPLGGGRRWSSLEFAEAEGVAICHPSRRVHGRCQFEFLWRNAVKFEHELRFICGTSQPVLDCNQSFRPAFAPEAPHSRRDVSPGRIAVRQKGIALWIK